MQALTRVVSEFMDGRVRGEYRSGGADDYAFAEAYDTLALQCWLWQQSVAGATEGETFSFEDAYDWQPSQLDTVSVETDPGFIDTYDPGFIDTDYEPGDFG